MGVFLACNVLKSQGNLSLNVLIKTVLIRKKSVILVLIAERLPKAFMNPQSGDSRLCVMKVFVGTKQTLKYLL